MRSGHSLRITTALGLVVVLGLVRIAQAHGMSMFVSTDGSYIEGMAYYDDGRGTRGALAELVIDGEVVATTETDDEGRFRFDMPVGSTDVEVRVDPGDGHRATWQLRPDQLVTAPPTEVAAAAPSRAGSSEEPMGAEAATGGEGSGVADAGLDDTGLTDTGLTDTDLADTDLAAIVAAEVDARVSQQIAGLREELALEARRKRFTDILGGIGYIVGMMGLAAYLTRRKG